MSKQVTLTIDDHQVTAPAGTVIVDAAKKIGINIPVFCHHPKIESVGMCRMCMVEIWRPVFDRGTGEPVYDEDGVTQKLRMGAGLETSCTVPISEGMVVKTSTDRVQEARQHMLEFLLTSHPLDCPVCDKGGECSLQDQTLEYGLADSRFKFDDKIQLGHHIPLGDLIVLDRDRCVQCARCIRFQAEIADDPVIKFYSRGRKTEIVTHSTPGFASYWSGNTTDICPVGALTTVDFRFGARAWELKTTPSICSHCAVGCNLVLDTRRDAKSGKIAIKRVRPRQNEWVNETWICDKGRFAHHFTDNSGRLTQPLMKDESGGLQPATWDAALKRVAESLGDSAAGSASLTLVGGRLSNEDYFNLHTLSNSLKGKAALYSSMAGGDLVAQVGVGQGTNLADLGPNDAILVIASDLEEEAPLWWLRIKAASERGATLIVANPRPTKTDRYADYILRYQYGAEVQTAQDLIDGKSEAAQAFAKAENAIVLYGSEGTSLEISQALSQACANLLIKTEHIGKANNGLIGVWQSANIQGAWDMGFSPVLDLESELSKAKLLYLVGADPVGDGLVDELQADFVIVQELFLTETAKQADVVLPAQAITERAGTFTSGERRVQRFEKAVPAPGETRPDYLIAAEIARALGQDMPENTLEEIAKQKPDYAQVSLQNLNKTLPQWPIVDGKETSYAGTVAPNTSLGLQLAPLAERAQAAEREDLSPGKVEPPAPVKVDGLLAVPITQLYDLGIMTTTSEILTPRLTDKHIGLHPADAAKQGINPGDRVTLSLQGSTTTAHAHLLKDVPQGIVVIPRSVGIFCESPTEVEIQLAE